MISVDTCGLYGRSVCWFVFCNCLGPVIGVFSGIGVLWAGTVFLLSCCQSCPYFVNG